MMTTARPQPRSWRLRPAPRVRCPACEHAPPANATHVAHRRVSALVLSLVARRALHPVGAGTAKRAVTGGFDGGPFGCQPGEVGQFMPDEGDILLRCDAVPFSG